MADHLVSEAFYLTDPDGLGIEVYADRPRESWAVREGKLAMATDPLDLDGLEKAAEVGDGTALLQVRASDTSTFTWTISPARGTSTTPESGLDRISLEFPGALHVGRRVSSPPGHQHLGRRRA